jgi:hypothetical protein
MLLARSENEAMTVNESNGDIREKTSPALTRPRMLPKIASAP